MKPRCPYCNHVMTATLEERFWAKIEMEPNSGCFIWMGKRKPNGYGIFNWDGKPGYAHRFAYQLTKGPIPSGLALDHLCRLRPCANAAHLEAVSQRENLLRGDTLTAFHATKTHCKHGHTLADAYVRKRGWRTCRTCVRIKNARGHPPRRQQTHCKHGHSLADAYVYRGIHHCRPCQRERTRQYLARHSQ